MFPNTAAQLTLDVTCLFLRRFETMKNRYWNNELQEGSDITDNSGIFSMENRLFENCSLVQMLESTIWVDGTDTFFA